METNETHIVLISHRLREETEKTRLTPWVIAWYEQSIHENIDSDSTVTSSSLKTERAWDTDNILRREILEVLTWKDKDSSNFKKNELTRRYCGW